MSAEDLKVRECWAVEARLYQNGMLVTKVRPAEPFEQSGVTEARGCDVWVDVFDTEEEAREFRKEYRTGMR